MTDDRQQRLGDSPSKPPAASATTTTSAADSESDFSSRSLSEAYRLATSLVSTDPTKAVTLLTQLQGRVASASLFSPNDSLDDLPTSSLPLLATEFHLAAALIGLRTSTAEERRVNVSRSLELYHEFMRRLDGLDGVLDDALARDYRQMMEADEANADSADGAGGDDEERRRRPRATTMTAGAAREAKIARFRARGAHQAELDRLTALRERRSRIGASETDELEGMDGDGVDRAMALAELRRCAADALDEVQSGVREMEMLVMAAKMERGRLDMERHRGGGGGGVGVGGGGGGGPDRRGPPPPHPPNSRQSGPMEVTRVTQDPTTGQLQFKREQVRSQVFRPGWNQPTMTLAEYGDMEVARAREREARQKKAEEESRGQPRRYEQLVKDGLEDDAKLVDASARLDREWDDWKDENPRGSGNKMADRGDRNF